MAAFTYKVEHQDGTPAEPPVLRTAVPTWRAGDTIPLGRDRMLRVVDVRPASEQEDDPVLLSKPSRPLREATGTWFVFAAHMSALDALEPSDETDRSEGRSFVFAPGIYGHAKGGAI